MIGYPAAEIMGKSCQTFVDELCSRLCGLTSPTEQPPMENRRCAIISKDGRRLQAIKNTHVVLDSKGRAVG